MTKKRRRARDEYGDQDASNASERGTLANPEPTSGVVERATGKRFEPSTTEREVVHDRYVHPDQRDTPELDLWAGRTPATPLLTAEEADRHADRIRAVWQEPGLIQLRRVARAREQAGGRAVLLEEELFPALSPAEADAYAARLRPSWQVPVAAPLTLASDVDARSLLDAALRDTEYLEDALPFPGEERPSATDQENAPAQSEEEARWRETLRSRRRRLHRWLIGVAAIASVAFLAGLALWRPRLAPFQSRPATATERAGLRGAQPRAIVAERSAESAALPEGASAPVASSTSGLEGSAAPAAAPAASVPVVPDATVRVRVSAEPPRARIRIDGQLVSNPFDERLPSGKRYRVLIQARGHESRDFTLTGSYDERISVRLVKQASSATAVPQPSAPQQSAPQQSR